MMNFLKDWIIQYQNKFLVGGVETTIDRITGTVSQEGDTIMASYLNEIQKNCIYQVNATRVVEGVLEIYDIKIDGSEEFTPFNQTFLIDFSATNTKVDSLLRFNGNTYSLRFINYNIDIAPAIGGIPKQALVILDVANSKAYIQSVPLEEKQIIGKIDYIPYSTVPIGYLKANGAVISRTTYANLFSVIGTTFGVGDGSTTFNLPDLRGYFIRGWDDSRGIDSGRAIGTSQTDDTKSHTHSGSTSTSAGAHTHSGSTSTTGAHTHNITTGDGGSYAGPYAQSRGRAQNNTTTTSDGGHAHTFSTDSQGDHTHTITVNATGGTETRPKNIALMAIIKY